MSSGAWILPPNYTYFLDRGLVSRLSQLFEASSVVELGAGKGCYADALRRAPSARGRQITVRAFDGAPDVSTITGGLVEHADLSSAIKMRPGDWVLCLETAEHIPREHEEQLMANLDRLNTMGLVLSWSNNAGGNGHVNLRTNEWVVQRFDAMGYMRDVAEERALRQAVSDIHWFRDTIMAFRRRTGVQARRRPSMTVHA